MEKLGIFLLFLTGRMFCSKAEIFNFESQHYSLEELYQQDNTDSVSIKILRSATAAELSSSSILAISTACPPKITPTADSTDYSLDTISVTFAPYQNDAEVTVTIIDDEEDEQREFFCLTIETSPGVEYVTRVYIPSNDYCIELGSYWPVPTVDADDIVEPEFVNYAGPWFVGDEGVSDTIRIDVIPEDGTDPVDIYLWFADTPDQLGALDGGAGEFLAILLDDTLAETHSGNVQDNGDSIVVSHNGYVDLLNDINGAQADGYVADVITPPSNDADAQNLQYTYDENSGRITLTDAGRGHEFTAQDTGNPVDVSHVFVSSGNDLAAFFQICGIEPRKLAPIAAHSSGAITGHSADKAIDGTRTFWHEYPFPGLYTPNCFLSTEDSNPWLQVDLGREYEVQLVLIRPYNYGVPGAASFDNGAVYVGSCPSTSITSNNACDSSINVAFADASILEVRCAGSSYGRYVYVTTNNEFNDINLCEIDIYGEEVPVPDQTTIELAATTFVTTNDESDQSVEVTVTRTSYSGTTCSSVDVYTDIASSIPLDDTQDFIPIYPGEPHTLVWDANDAATKTVTVTITDDDECEPTESFNVFLANVDGGILGTQTCSLVSILDDDIVTYGLEDTDLSITVEEGQSVDICVTRSNDKQDGLAKLVFTDVTAWTNDYNNIDGVVPFTAYGTNTKCHTVNTVDDQCYEEDETFTVHIGEIQPSDCSSLNSNDPLIVTILDNESYFYWDDTDIDGSIVRIPEGTSKTTLDISRVGLVQAKTVGIEVEDISTDSQIDYTVSDSSVTFEADDQSVSIEIDVEDDEIVESEESFTLTLQDQDQCRTNLGYLDGHVYKLTVVIVENDDWYTWKQSQYNVNEGTPSGTLEVCLLRSGVSLPYKVVGIIILSSGSALSGVDFTPVSSIIFTAGSIEACGTVGIANDNTVEGDETFTMEIQSAQGVVIGNTALTTVTVVDDDCTVEWGSSTYTFIENAALVSVTILKTGSGYLDLTLTTQGTATNCPDDTSTDCDYTVQSTISIGEGTNVLPLYIIDDGIRETGGESFTITFSAADITSTQTQITITDEDNDNNGNGNDNGNQGQGQGQGQNQFQVGGGAVAATTVAGVIAGGVTVGAVAVVIWLVSRASSAATTAATTAAGQALNGGYLVNSGANPSTFSQISTGTGFP